MEGTEEIIGEDNKIETPESDITFSAVSNDESEEEVVNIENTIETQIDDIVETQDNDIDVEENVEIEDDYEVLELDEKTAWEFLKSQKGITADNIDELLNPKEQKKYAPEMEKFNEFIERTGNKNYNDFLETQKDWSVETPENVLRSYIKLSNPEFSEKEVNHLYNKKYNTSELDEYDDEDEILEKGINIKSDLKKANAFFEQRKEEFNAIGGSDEHIPIEYREAKQLLENQKQQEEAYIIERETSRNDFISKTESLFNRNFEGFKIKLGDEKIGFEDLSIKPDNIEEIKEFQSDSNNFIKKFLDSKTGELIDPKGYHKGLYMAYNYEAAMNKAYNLGRAKELELQDKLSKNIQPDNMRNAPNNTSSGITFTKE